MMEANTDRCSTTPAAMTQGRARRFQMSRATQGPRRPERELPEPVPGPAPAVDRQGDAGGGERQVQPEEPQEDVGGVEHQDVAALEGHQHDEGHHCRHTGVETDEQAAGGHHEEPEEGEQGGIGGEHLQQRPGIPAPGR